MRSNYILLLVLLANSTIRAQGYKQKQFDKMVNKLLSHTVAEVNAKNTPYDSSIIYLDAREIVEYNTSKIPKALWVGYNDFNLARVEKIDKNQNIIVYCSVGYRSEKIAEKLKMDGFTHVSNMVGGLFEWVNYNKKVVDSKNNQTTNIHAFDQEWGKWLDEELVKKVFD